MTSLDSLQPEFLVLVAYAAATLDRADELVREGKGAEAEALIRSVVSAGRHLTRESPSLLVHLAGLSFKRRGMERYNRFLRDHMRSAEARDGEAYLKSLRERQTRLNMMAQVILGEMDEFACLPAAARIALEHPEKFWRREAALRLGVMRWGAPNLAQSALEDKLVMDHDDASQNHALNVLTRMIEHDPDPHVRELALWTFRNLTPEMFVSMRHRTLFRPLIE